MLTLRQRIYLDALSLTAVNRFDMHSCLSPPERMPRQYNRNHDAADESRDVDTDHTCDRHRL